MELLNNERLSGTTSADEEFKKEILDLASKLKNYGFDKQAFSKEAVYQKLDGQAKQDILASLKTYNKIINGSDLENSEMTYDLRFIWSAFKEFSITPPEDLLDYYKKGYIFEIYDSKGRQLFRNFEFFELCGYSLEDIFCKSWFELYSRDESVTRKIFEYGARYASGDLTGVTLKPCLPHLLTEIDSEAGHIVEMDIKALVPMKSLNSEEIFVAAIEECKYSIVESKINDPNVSKVAVEFAKPGLKLV